MSYRCHVFVCENARPDGGKPSCGPRGGVAVRAALERALAAEPALWGQVAVTGATCLGPCFDGPTAVVYPEGVWYGGLAPEDVPALVREHLLGGRPLETRRLLRLRAEDGPALRMPGQGDPDEGE